MGLLRGPLVVEGILHAAAALVAMGVLYAGLPGKAQLAP